MDMEKRELTCIRCPLGCAITVTLEGSTIQEITGFTCKRGEDYARKEVLDPTRTVTSVVFIDSESERMLPVKTKEDIPKDKIFEIMEALKRETPADHEALMAWLLRAKSHNGFYIFGL